MKFKKAKYEEMIIFEKMSLDGVSIVVLFKNSA